jgi:hypothetical protein
MGVATTNLLNSHASRPLQNISGSAPELIPLLYILDLSELATARALGIPGADLETL